MSTTTTSTNPKRATRPARLTRKPEVTPDAPKEARRTGRAQRKAGEAAPTPAARGVVLLAGFTRIESPDGRRVDRPCEVYALARSVNGGVVRETFVRGAPVLVDVDRLGDFTKLPSCDMRGHYYGEAEFVPMFRVWSSEAAYRAEAQAQAGHIDEERLEAARAEAARLIASAMTPRAATGTITPALPPLPRKGR